MSNHFNHINKKTVKLNEFSFFPPISAYYENFQFNKVHLNYHTILFNGLITAWHGQINSKFGIIINDKAKVVFNNNVNFFGNVYLLNSEDCEAIMNLENVGEIEKYFKEHNFKSVFYNKEPLSVHSQELSILHDQYYATANSDSL